MAVPEGKELPAPPEPTPSVKQEPVTVLSEEREELLKYEEGVRVFREGNRPQEAFDMLQGFLSMHPDSVYADDALLEQARIQSHLEENSKALKLINRLLRSYPNTPLRKRAFLDAGSIYSQMGKWKDCVQAMDNAFQYDLLENERSGALSLRAVCLIERRKYQDAVWDAMEAFMVASTDEAREGASSLLERAAGELKDRELDRLLLGSDGSAAYGLLAMERLDRLIEEGLYEEAIRELMDILVHYPGLVPAERIENAYAAVSDRLLVRGDTIGAVLPLSGRYRVYGEKALQGIQAALGLLDPVTERSTGSYNLVVEDSGADPAMAKRAVIKLVNDHQALVIIGPLLSKTSRAAAKAVKGKGVPLISLSPDPAIPGLNRNVFRRALTDEQQVRILVEMAYGRLMMRKFAFLHPDTSYGREMTQLFWDELDLRGAEVTAIESFEPGQTDFGPQIRSLVGLNRKLSPEQKILKDSGVEVELEAVVDFDALFIPADFQTVGLLAPQLAFYDVTTPTLLGTDGWNSPWVVELGEHYVEGAIFTGNYLPDMEYGASRELAERYWLTFGEDPQPLAAQAFDAALIVRTGVESGIVHDRTSLRKYLMELKGFQAAEGPLTTDDDGDIVQMPHLLTVKSGEIVPFVREID